MDVIRKVSVVWDKGFYKGFGGCKVLVRGVIRGFIKLIFYG